MKRADAINYIRIAGYHDDRAAFTRLYVENRVSYTAAKDAFAKGRELRAAGMKCSCYECRQT